jgi:hypothetical protein
MMTAYQASLLLLRAPGCGSPALRTRTPQSLPACCSSQQQSAHGWRSVQRAGKSLWVCSALLLLRTATAGLCRGWAAGRQRGVGVLALLVASLAVACLLRCTCRVLVPAGRAGCTACGRRSGECGWLEV